MAVRPVEDGLMRFGIGAGAALLLIRRFIAPPEGSILFYTGRTLVVFCLAGMPKLPLRYRNQ